MRTLADLFTDDVRAADERDRVMDPVVDRAKWAAILGAPRRSSETPRTRPVDDTAELVAMVSTASAAAAASRSMSSGAVPKPPRRGHKRADWVNISVAVVAVIAVAAAAAFGAVQVANSTPAASALQSLAADEAELANAEQAIALRVETIEDQIADVRGEADAAVPALAAVEGYVPDRERDAALAAVDTLIARIDAIELPTLAEPYSRPDFDASELSNVAAQIDVVRLRAETLPALTEGTQKAQSEVAAAREEFLAKIGRLGATFPAAAEAEVAANIEAEPVFAEAVIAGAEDVIRVQRAGKIGAAAMLAYPGLVDALREDHARAIEEILSAEEPPAEDPGTWTPGDPVAPTDPEPTDREPTDPEPTDPEPTDPDPDPEPIDPEPIDPEPTNPPELPGDGTLLPGVPSP
ncbi:hypothetical protein LG315_10595 [Microbacterium marinum]|uniref:hypothetical protein n=1 Tax=Microbacterium marinum TaxID=421115 RepID=UPI00384F83DF